MHIRSIGIIGYGSFGRFVHELIREVSPDLLVRVSSIGDVPPEVFSSMEDVAACDLVFLCVPISAYREVVGDIAPLVADRTILVDIATVKMHTISILKEHDISRYIATHPMFGSYSYAKHGNSLSGLRIALCDSSLSDEETNSVRIFLTTLGLRILDLTPEEHDRLIAETLFLTHLVGQTVHRGGFERTSIDTVSFGYLMDAVESVAQDEALFHDVYTYNPHCKEVLRRFEAAERDVIHFLQRLS